MTNDTVKSNDEPADVAFSNGQADAIVRLRALLRLAR
jgi:hypothetical protein